MKKRLFAKFLVGSKAPKLICGLFLSVVSANSYGYADTLKLSQVLTTNTSQKMVLPQAEIDRFEGLSDADIVADLANRRMFVRNDAGLTVYRMGIGRPAAKIPYGRTKITMRRSNPLWTPTPEARKRNPFLPKNMISSADNPLGARALNLTWKYYLIHGTNDHEKIGRSATWGCMSLADDDVIEVHASMRNGRVVDVFKQIDFELGSNKDALLPIASIVKPKPKPEFIGPTLKKQVAALSLDK